MKKFLLLALATFVLTLSTSAWGQARSWYRRPGVYGARTAVGPVGYGYGGNFSSTAAEGAQRGRAEVIRAQGEGYKNYTQGLNNYEEARSKYIDNKAKWTETYWKRKRLGEAERRKDYDRKMASYHKYSATRKSGGPTPLSVAELDPYTGKISWPAALESVQYEELRGELEEMLLLRTHTRTDDNSAEIHQKARAMQAELKKNIRGMPANDYIAARKFLDSLALTGRHPVG